MTPISYNGEVTIPIAVFAKITQNILGDYLPLTVTILITIAAIISISTKLFKPKFIMNNDFLKSLFYVKPIWLLGRIFGAIIVLLSYFQVGPEILSSDLTGSFILTGLLPTLIVVFFFAGLLLPLLLNFGLLEFCGSLLTKIMRPLFKLPGRSSIDCMTSWLGDGTIGVLLTSKQYEEGFYNEREACVVSTTFSVVSVTFCFVIISQVNLSHLFVPFYLTVTFSGIVAAIILPRIWPLKNKPDNYFEGRISQNVETVPEGFTPFSFGVNQAIKKASSQTKISQFFIDGIKNILEMWIGVLPIVMAMGTLALIIAEYTNIFQVLGLPFIPIFKLLGIPEAQAASQTVIVGFADMFLPSVIATKTITSDMTKFIIACVSVTQLIYLSEVGSVILGSKIPLNIRELFLIFLTRTLITLPVITIIAHILF
ncbi:YjiH family protein [Clostridium tarantellae]|uniref:YjiH family protein n=2 Tax=Clostridium tarantellae TaxID=39493 RepID=A0A6I1MLX9_9CLOT|nr:YjiH family protein [Clostridium tarantellae]